MKTIISCLLGNLSVWIHNFCKPVAIETIMWCQLVQLCYCSKYLEVLFSHCSFSTVFDWLRFFSVCNACVLVNIFFIILILYRKKKNQNLLSNSSIYGTHKLLSEFGRLLSISTRNYHPTLRTESCLITSGAGHHNVPMAVKQRTLGVAARSLTGAEVRRRTRTDGGDLCGLDNQTP